MSEKLKNRSAKFAAEYLATLDTLSRTFTPHHIQMLEDKKSFQDHIWLKILCKKIEENQHLKKKHHVAKLIRNLDAPERSNLVARLNLADDFVVVNATLRHWATIQKQQRHYNHTFDRRAKKFRHNARDFLRPTEPEMRELLSARRDCRDVHDSMECLAGKLVKSLKDIAESLAIIAYGSGATLTSSQELLLDDLISLRSRCEPCRDPGVDSFSYEVDMLTYHTLIGDQTHQGWYDLHTDAIVAHEKYDTALNAVNEIIGRTF